MSNKCLIHCDIKPRNLIVSENQVQAIDLDFDFVKSHDIILKAIQFSLNKTENPDIQSFLTSINASIIKDFSKLFMSIIISGTIKNSSINFKEYLLKNNNSP